LRLWNAPSASPKSTASAPCAASQRMGEPCSRKAACAEACQGSATAPTRYIANSGSRLPATRANEQAAPTFVASAARSRAARSRGGSGQSTGTVSSHSGNACRLACRNPNAAASPASGPSWPTTSSWIVGARRAYISMLRLATITTRLHWLRNRSCTCSTSGRPHNGSKPLSASPTRRPAPPARITPSVSSAATHVADHPPAFALLALGEHVALARVRIFAFAELDADWRAFQLVALSVEVFEIAPIAVRDVLGAAAVDHDGRRMVTTGMREAQLGRVSAYQRRLVGRDSFFQRAREVGGAEFACRRCTGAVDGAHQFAQAGSVFRRQEHDARPRHEVELAFEAGLAAFAIVLFQAIPFVGDDHQRAACFEYLPDQGQILVGDALARIQHHRRDVGRGDRLQRLDDAEFFQRLFDTAAAADSGGVDQDVPLAVALQRNVDRIARGTGDVGHHHA